MQFSRIRLSGFKSFVDPTELYIEPGLTGIVGPNGCGKSNIVEALRWVMGETSAKQMRGGEMDDIIFSGTVERPARNLSEVVLTIDNADRTAPAQFNDAQELDIARRIERGSGSSYRINGREVRARDVQTLFADAASGARSNSMVSQGRVGAIISAKPTDRRLLLEEAAGITGLHSRRHEAELRLRAAESNLERLDDVITSLEEQYRALKRQARQASRYRNLSGHIRHAEAVVLHHRWTAATETRDRAAAALADAEERVADVTREVAVATTARAEAAAAVPGLRQREAEAAAALQRLMVARDALEREEQRLNEMRADLEARLAQIDGDTEREKALRGDADAAITRLDAETAALRSAQATEAEQIEAANQALAEIEAEVAAFDQEVTEATRRAAADEASKTTLERQIGEQGQRRQRLIERQADIAAQLRDAEATAADREAMKQTRTAAAAARSRLDAARTRLEEAERQRAAAQQEAERARDALQDRVAATGKLRAEEEALSALLQVADPDLWPPMIDAVDVDPGFEVALGAALGDDLVAPGDESAPVHWRALPPFDVPAALPAGTTPLARHVRTPGALTRRLSQIGVVDDDSEGERLRGQLAQGQRLVSKAGSLWRWDGFTAAAGAPTAATRRLEQRNRLVDVAAGRQQAEALEGDARRRYDTLNEKAQAALAAERAARDDAWSTDRVYQEARDAETAAAQRAANAQSRLESLAAAQTGLRSDLAELETMIDASRAELDGFADLPRRQEALARRRDELAGRRRVLLERQGSRDQLHRDAEARRARTDAIEGDVRSWRARAENAERQMQQLAERRRAIADEAARLEARPAEIAGQRARLFEQIEQAESRRNIAADALAEAENRLEAAGAGLRECEARLGEAREERVRREGAVEQASQARTTVAERVRERLACAPDRILAVAGISEDDELPPLDATEAKLERLVRERDNMGPVNLRAEMEAEELNEKIATTQGERDDLIAAISKLRRGMSELNREGRERLMAAFGQVDSHFQALFQKLFGGGRAHLSLTEAEDPLDAGLEIMASPPGKRLQSMSLLSGGEQALTAISLLFAVFMTNPAPVCVLDEVDAPLDDNNVDRFCSMLEDISARTSTRFLLITHHRLTMARMDRLYGVTMPERGVSQLVSVDLGTADRLRESA